MGETTNIEWADRTWSPWIGCTKISPACDGCYAAHLMDTRLGRVEWGPHGERSRTSDGYWRKLATWNRDAVSFGRPVSVFPSLCDPFDNRADPGIRREWFAKIRRYPNLLWLLLTKRPQNIIEQVEAVGGLPGNVALGATCEDQKRLEANVLPLLEAAHRLEPAFTFLSCEPLLEGLDLRRIKVSPRGIYLDALTGSFSAEAGFSGGLANVQAGLDALPPLPSRRPAIGWIITGGETDQGGHQSRPSNPQWFREIRDQCAAAGVPYLHKQNGEWAAYDQIGAGGWEFTREKDGVRYGRLTNHFDGEATSPLIGREFETRYPWGPATLEAGSSPCMVKVGKKAAGRMLDRRTHDGMPAR